MNEEWRMRYISKNKIHAATTIGYLMNLYGLGDKPSLFDRLTGLFNSRV